MAHPDFEEFIGALNESGVRYLIVGAHAVAFHARPRATKDLDILIEPTKANARRALKALAAFFSDSPPPYSIADFTDADVVIQLGVAPVRIDLLATIAGVSSFRTAWRRRVDARFGSVASHYLSLPDLIAAKLAADRPQDRADIVSLRRAEGRARGRRARVARAGR